MRILLHRRDDIYAPWLRDFAAMMPEADVVVWREKGEDDVEDIAPCDYAVLWSPPPAMLPALAHVKAIFLTGAGADGLLKYGDAVPQVPIVRLGDAGMALHMIEYITHATLRYFRRFDQYEAQARNGQWRQLDAIARAEFSVGVLGAGVLGTRVLQALAPYGFPLRAWNRGVKQIAGVQCYAGTDSLADFLRGTRVLVCMLPLTPETTNLLDRAHLALLPAGAYLINVGRGGHVAEPDLLALVKSGHIAGATLDVFRNEPLPGPHPFWEEPRITITPHIAALTLVTESVEQIVAKMRALERDEPIDDVVDRSKGY